ncbi:LOW QUALITY PROTEIN: sodium bicarbonate cotransporter 3 [Pyxicephalus adspersus]|uniref:LOW QUALITY PROTEIN: sodium bicarbonate cotransporter 3 n=1 Tax=Pyxicephalus adspersus TaxID=30357 RepID=UPI003B5A265C
MDEDRVGEQMRPLLTTGHDEEAVVDLGKTSSTVNTNFEKEELESHRAVYIGVHVPHGRQSRRRHRHRGHRHHRKRREKENDRDDGRESPNYDTPSQRVQFILGTEDDDEEHIPHDLFTEMDELCFRDGEECEWKETARWLKFEEDVEDGGDRWSKPYVATLSLHSLFELRSCILNGTVMLDMRASTIEEIADMVMDNMTASGQLDDSMREHVREALLKRHHHQNEKKLSNRIPLVRSFADIGKKHSDPHLLERNGEGLSASRNSLRAESRLSLLLNYLLPPSRVGTPTGSRRTTPVPTPQNTPPGSPKFDRLPSTSSHQSEWVPLTQQCTGDDIPTVVIHPPDEEDENPEALDTKKEEFHDFDPGLLSSPQSTPANLDSSRLSDLKRNGTGGGSQENSTVDFSKDYDSWHCNCGTFVMGRKRSAVDMNFMRKIPPGAEASNVLVGEVDFLDRPIIAFVRLSPAVLLTGLTEVPIPTRFLFVLLGPTGKAAQYHEIGRSIATLMTDEIFHDVAYKAKDRNDLLAGIDEFLDQVTVLPPGEWDPSIRIEPPKSVPSQEKRKIPTIPNGSTPTGETFKEEQHHAGPELQRTGRLFGGLMHDIKRKAPFFLSDFKDALSLQCLASVLFLYCACMSPVITFGGLLGEATQNRISAIESLFGASLTGIAYSLFAGQPLTILGSTGPVLVFEKILFKFCKEFDLAFICLCLLLQKGCGYHLDLFMVAIMLGVCSLMGLPWFVAATVLSISHVNSLKVESECSAPGEQPKFLGIKEQRVTGLLIFVLMGLSVFMTSVLKFIPMPVLYGVFLYMGVSSLKGIQFFDRIKLFGMPAKHQPDLIYLRYVPLWKVHVFTVIQLTCLVLLWVIKVSQAAVVFPMMVLALVFIRKLLDFCFTKRELSWLDDLMPESKKKKEDDKKKKEKEIEDDSPEEAERMLQVDDSDNVQLAYEGRNVLQIPVKSLKYSLDPSVVNISDEMAKTAQWKALSMNPENAKSKSNQSPDKPVSVKITLDDSSLRKYVDAETSV